MSRDGNAVLIVGNFLRETLGHGSVCEELGDQVAECLVLRGLGQQREGLARAGPRLEAAEARVVLPGEGAEEERDEAPVTRVDAGSAQALVRGALWEVWREGDDDPDGAAECRAQARHGVAARQWFGRDGHAAQPLELLVQAVEQILVTGMLAVQDDHGRRHGRYSIAPARLRDVWDLRGPRPPEAMSVGPFTNRRTQSAVHAMSGLWTANRAAAGCVKAWKSTQRAAKVRRKTRM